MNLIPYCHVIKKATAVLPEELADRICELASTYEASCDKAESPDWNAFNRMENMVMEAVYMFPEFQDAIDKA